jgi:glyoxylase-like metal-dependent hydrolase (beta-lactamase superfamily II)
VRRFLVVLALLVGAVVAYAAIGLAWAHVEIRSLDPELPATAEILAPPADHDLPVRVTWYDTAVQPMPRSAVLDPARDPAPNQPYAMSHSSFALEWSDGRIFLIDAGMDRDSALAFGANLERLGGAQAIEPLGSAADQLGEATSRVAGIGFTHLHTDHTAGVAELCRRSGRRIRLVRGELAAERTNYTTRGGAQQLADAPCLDAERLEAGALAPVRGFPGLAVIAAAGHTPCSQVFVAFVRDGAAPRTYVFTGDVVNQIDGARHDVPKPALYSLLLVPESTARLARLRALLHELESRGATLLVSHDRLALEASGVPRGRSGT